jgi:2'-5' RNA ligase
MAKIRTFIAVEATDAVHAAAMSVIDRLQSAADNVKWVEPDNLHWTLQFLGDVDDVDLHQVCKQTALAAAEHEAFSLSAVGVGAFPSPARPRTLWLGAGSGSDELIALQESIEQRLAPLGFRGEHRQFVPHLTIGRVGRGSHGGDLLAERLEKLTDFAGGEMPVDRVTVFSSELERHGPVYHVMAQADLA